MVVSNTYFSSCKIWLTTSKIFSTRGRISLTLPITLVYSLYSNSSQLTFQDSRYSAFKIRLPFLTQIIQFIIFSKLSRYLQAPILSIQWIIPVVLISILNKSVRTSSTTIYIYICNLNSYIYIVPIYIVVLDVLTLLFNIPILSVFNLCHIKNQIINVSK